MRCNVHINPDIEAVEELLSPPISWQNTFQLPQKLHSVGSLQHLHPCKMQLSLFTEVMGWRVLQGLWSQTCTNCTWGRAALCQDFALQGHRGLAPGSRWWGVCCATLFAAPDCTWWLHLIPGSPPKSACCWPAQFHLLWVSNHLHGKRKRDFFILEGLRPLQIQDQMRMQRWVQSLSLTAKYTHKIPV